MCLGIRHIGETVAKKISNKIGSFEKLSLLTEDEILKIDDFEFIEFTNISLEPHNLEGYELLGAVRHKFGNYILGSFDQIQTLVLHQRVGRLKKLNYIKIY